MAVFHNLPASRHVGTCRHPASRPSPRQNGQKHGCHIGKEKWKTNELGDTRTCVSQPSHRIGVDLPACRDSCAGTLNIRWETWPRWAAPKSPPPAPSCLLLPIDCPFGHHFACPVAQISVWWQRCGLPVTKCRRRAAGTRLLNVLTSAR